jgi:hypothetical protein
MSGYYACLLSVVTKYSAQPCSGEGLSSMWTLSDQEEDFGGGFGSFSQKIGLDQGTNIDIERDAALLGTLA